MDSSTGTHIMLPEELRLQRLGIYSFVAKGGLYLNDPIVCDLLMDGEPNGKPYAGNKAQIIGTNFAYKPGSITVRFSQKEFDYIYLDNRAATPCRSRPLQPYT
jgi:hypothetical protein